MLEPDDYAYKASIIALRHGEILLTNAQYATLGRMTQILQWHHMSSGLWISEKNPGYPFAAELFYAVGALRLAPIFYGALACVGLFLGANRWLGRPGGALAVGLYLTSGAALTFAWRSTMPSFTDASLIAAGAGLLLWTMLAIEASGRRRLLVGLAGFVALEAAVFIRYTNVIELGVAVLAVALLGRRMRVSWGALLTWAGSLAAFAIGTLAFNVWAYGSATSTGYSAGEITFSLSALWPNLRLMPWQLTQSMPLWLLAAAGLVLLALTARQRGMRNGRTDLAVGAVLATGWFGLWLLYLNYTWTANMVGGHGGGGGTVHVIRFYLPALGLIALLAAAPLRRLPRVVSLGALAGLAVAALFSFSAMASGSMGLGGGPGGGGQGGFPPGGGQHSGQPPTGTPRGQGGLQGTRPTGTKGRFPSGGRPTGQPGRFGPPPTGAGQGPNFGNGGTGG
jgi:hypothetical protein